MFKEYFNHLLYRIKRTWNLLKVGFSIIKKDREMLLLPLMAFLITFLFFLAFGLAAFINEGSGWALTIFLSRIIGISSESTLAFYLFAFFSTLPLLAFLLYVLYIFFGFFPTVRFFDAAIIKYASIRLTGGDPKISDCLRAAWKVKGRIWKLAQTELLVKVTTHIGKKKGIPGAGVAELAWELGTFFMLPMLVLENLNIKDAAKRSIELLKKNWPEIIIGSFAFGLISFLFTLPAIILIILSVIFKEGLLAGLLFISAILYVFGIAIFLSAAWGCTKTALYLYATGKKIKGVPKKLLEDPFVHQ